MRRLTFCLAKNLVKLFLFYVFMLFYVIELKYQHCNSGDLGDTRPSVFNSSCSDPLTFSDVFHPIGLCDRPNTFIRQITVYFGC